MGVIDLKDSSFRPFKFEVEEPERVKYVQVDFKKDFICIKTNTSRRSPGPEKLELDTIYFVDVEREQLETVRRGSSLRSQ
jgi:hypothetical protein